jgi:hypothetical protein
MGRVCKWCSVVFLEEFHDWMHAVVDMLDLVVHTLPHFFLIPLGTALLYSASVKWGHQVSRQPHFAPRVFLSTNIFNSTPFNQLDSYGYTKRTGHSWGYLEPIY